MQVGIATTSRLAADAGAAIAEAGGNAIDTAIAGSLVSLVSEPGMVSLAGGGFLTIWPAEGAPVTVDGGVAMPGLGGDRRPNEAKLTRIRMEYGGGLDTLIGPGSVATPGILAAFAEASKRFGRVPWHELFGPAIEVARNGFPLSSAAHRFMTHVHQQIYGLDPASHRALHHPDGTLKGIGETVFVEHLAESLKGIADEGAELFYAGELGHRIADHLRESGGFLGRKDLAGYRAALLDPVSLPMGRWTVVSSPPPSLGGPVLAAMLCLAGDRPVESWSAAEVDFLIRLQVAALDHRFERLDLSADLEADARSLLELAAEQPELLLSPSTVHTSAVDAHGSACSITASAGYGSGDLPPGTGIWMNNTLGELELNRRGLEAWAPGERLYSNMAPSVVRRDDGTILAIGSPGADRITTAQAQVILNHLNLGLSLERATAHPRLHVERVEGRHVVAFEPGLPVSGLDYDQRPFDALDAYFGGVAAVSHHPLRGFELAADPRRAGATALAG
ncbi:MAG: gamma-glutamyltransferase [Xanthomonadales bacterium]|nr:gamma-glutamyltransferase [Xanthomonadales bacterium]